MTGQLTTWGETRDALRREYAAELRGEPEARDMQVRLWLAAWARDVVAAAWSGGISDRVRTSYLRTMGKAAERNLPSPRMLREACPYHARDCQ